MVGFFGQCVQIEQNSTEIEDLLLHRYGGNIEYIFNKPIPQAIELINVATLKEAEEKLFKIYVSKLTFADKNFPTFDEVLKNAKKEAYKPSSNSMSWEEAEKIANDISNRFKSKRDKGVD